jgi:hypothetical protein
MADVKNTAEIEAADCLVEVPLPPPGLDQTPPDDHDDFVELRSFGLRGIREDLERRRKKA